MVPISLDEYKDYLLKKIYMNLIIQNLIFLREKMY